MDIFLHKRIASLQKAFINPPEHTLMMDGCGWKHFFQLVLIDPYHCHYKAQMRRDIY